MQGRKVILALWALGVLGLFCLAAGEAVQDGKGLGLAFAPLPSKLNRTYLSLGGVILLSYRA